MSNAIAASGTKFAIGNGATPTETFAYIAEAKSLSGPNMTVDLIDVTNMDSLNNTREKIAGLIDPGEMNFTLNFQPGLAAHQAVLDDMKNRVKRNFKLEFPDPEDTVWNLTGFITSFEVTSETEGVLEASVTISLTGFPSFS